VVKCRLVPFGRPRTALHIAPAHRFVAPISVAMTDKRALSAFKSRSHRRAHYRSRIAIASPHNTAVMMAVRITSAGESVFIEPLMLG
jgi:hypothetical protein